MRTPANIKKPALVLGIYYAFMGSCLFLLQSRGYLHFWHTLPTAIGSLELNTHITNFSISAILLMGAAAYPLVRRQVKLIIGMGTSLIAVNLIVELGVTYLNVPDPLDALAGLLGILFASLGLWLTDRYGHK